MGVVRDVDGDDIEQHFQYMEAGTSLGRDLDMMIVLRSLPKSFNTLTTVLDCCKEDEVTLELVKQKVIDEVLKRRQPSRSSSVGAKQGNVYDCVPQLQKR